MTNQPMAGRWLPPSIYMLAVATFVVGTDKDLLVGLLTAMSDDLDTRPELVVQLSTVFALTYAVAAPLLAVGFARWPRRRLMVIALSVFTVANLLCAVAPNFELLLAGRVLAALGAAAFTPAAAAAGAAAAGPERAGRALAIVFAGFSVASVVGVPLGSIIGREAGWRWIFVAIATIAAIVTLGLGRYLGRISAPPVASLPARVAVLKDSRVRRVLLVSGVAQAAGFAFFLLISLYAEHTTGDDSIVPIAILGFGLSGLAGTWVAGRMSDRANPLAAMRGALVLAAVALLAMPVLVQGPVSLVILVSIWAFGQWSITVPVQATLLRLHPHTGAIAVSLNSSAMYLGSACAGLIGAGTVDALGVSWLPLGAGVLLLAALAVGMSIRGGPAQNPALVSSPANE